METWKPRAREGGQREDLLIALCVCRVCNMNDVRNESALCVCVVLLFITFLLGNRAPTRTVRRRVADDPRAWRTPYPCACRTSLAELLMKGG